MSNKCNKTSCERSSQLVLTDAGKEQLALAILLLRDLKSQYTKEEDKFKLITEIMYLVKTLGITKEFDKAMATYPVAKITFP
jgi:hypothetical protein